MSFQDIVHTFFLGHSPYFEFFPMDELRDDLFKAARDHQLSLTEDEWDSMWNQDAEMALQTAGKRLPNNIQTPKSICSDMVRERRAKFTQDVVSTFTSLWFPPGGSATDTAAVENVDYSFDGDARVGKIAWTQSANPDPVTEWTSEPELMRQFISLLLDRHKIEYSSRTYVRPGVLKEVSGIPLDVVAFAMSCGDKVIALRSKGLLGTDQLNMWESAVVMDLDRSITDVSTGEKKWPGKKVLVRTLFRLRRNWLTTFQ